MKRYVIITPAHNEDSFIEKTITSVVAQTVLPLKWVIVNDGSTDRTGEIVEGYARRYGLIQLVNLRRDGDRDFGRKVIAFNQGLAELRGLDFDYIGNLDADISFEPTYFDNIIGEFEADSKLGISGGIVYTNIGGRFITHDATLDSVGGAVQLFRHECFEDVGGYLPLKHGGIDAAAEIMARMKGWRVKKSLNDRVFEHRRTGSANAKPLVAKMREGRRFRSLGYGPLFYSLRCIYRLGDHPIVFGSVAAWLGYLFSAISRQPIVLPPEAIRHLRSEQKERLRRAYAVRSS